MHKNNLPIQVLFFLLNQDWPLLYHTQSQSLYPLLKSISNGCFDALEVKVNIDISKYQEKVKPISQFQRFLSFFNGLLEFASLPNEIIVKIL